ncbi:MAG: hypothetical protein KJ638_14890, partial [Chloroflexi bacterium]|nr:hypothetical protein [Chloroflexota bacterium]
LERIRVNTGTRTSPKISAITFASISKLLSRQKRLLRRRLRMPDQDLIALFIQFDRAVASRYFGDRVIF